MVDPSSQALALHFAAMLHQCRREHRAAIACAELSLTIAVDQGLSFWKASGTIMRGWAIAEGGNGAEGIALMRQGLDAWQATGSVTYRTYFLALLAEALGREGQADEAMRLLDEALELAARTSERFYAPELHRLKGELLQKQGAAGGAAEASFREALELARGQKAKAWELRPHQSRA